MEVLLYKRPDARKVIIDMTNIHEADEKFFLDNNIKVSLEEGPAQFFIYADVGYRIDDDENEDPDEIVIISDGRSCESTMSELRYECEEAMKLKRPRFGPEPWEFSYDN